VTPPERRRGRHGVSQRRVRALERGHVVRQLRPGDVPPHGMAAAASGTPLALRLDMDDGSSA
jgi:hypothetical protein